LFYEWAISFSNAKGVCHLVFFIIRWRGCGFLLAMVHNYDDAQCVEYIGLSIFFFWIC
jgi:hypothetical protein